MEQCCFVIAFDDHINDIYLEIPTNLVFKHFVHQALVHCPGVLETEWHLPVAKGATIGLKDCFLLIFSFHLDLMIALVSIKETLELKSFQGLTFWPISRKG